jgi:hypothetical protein
MTPPRPGQDGRSIRRLGLWIAVLALPLAALALLLAEPDLDMRWEHHPSHFWLVLTVAGVNVVLGLVASEAAARRDDARTFLVSMALLTSAGFWDFTRWRRQAFSLTTRPRASRSRRGWGCSSRPASPQSPHSTPIHGSFASWHGVTAGYKRPWNGSLRCAHDGLRWPTR